MLDNYTPFSSGIVVEFNDDEIERGQINPNFILRAAEAVQEHMEDGKDDIEVSLSNPAEDVVSQYNIRVSGNVYSFRVQKWDATFKRMKHDLENTSVVLKAGDIEIIEQDFTIEMEDYLEEEGFDVTVTDEEIEGPEAEEAREFIEEKFGM